MTDAPGEEELVEAEDSVSDVADEDAAGEDTASEDEEREITFRVMTVESIIFDLSESAPQVHLMEAEEPYRSLSIPIALPEAQALYRAVSFIESRRPGTHELMSSILERLQVDVVAARIVREENGVFYAELDLMGPRGREVFDARTSDALILASRLRVAAPILCNEELLIEEFLEDE